MKVTKSSMTSMGGEYVAHAIDDTGEVIFRVYGSTAAECDARKFWLADMAQCDNQGLSVVMLDHRDSRAFDAWKASRNPGCAAA